VIPARHLVAPDLVSTGNQVPVPPVQRQVMPGFQMVAQGTPTPRLVDPADLLPCRSMAQAVAQTALMSGVQQKALAADLGMSEPQLTRVLHGERSMPSRAMVAFYQRCGNVYALQWLAWQLGFELVPRRPMTDAEKAAAFDAMTQGGAR